ncbi:MAG: hypothetical protein V1888_03855 [archaeon]
MKIKKLIPVVVIIGIVVLFMFPEPESNFGWYVLTMGLFAGVVGVLFWLGRKS